MNKTGQLRLEWADLDLEPCDGIVEGPTSDDVHSIVEHLGKCESGFVILAKDELSYLQTTLAEPGEPEAGFVIEYQDGTTDRHFVLDEEFVDLARVLEVFSVYFKRAIDIAAIGTWKKLDL